jgi:NAD+ synthase
MIKENKIEDLLDSICKEIKNFTDVGILGVSGGADSTLVACLLKRALGAENTFVVSMPYNEVDYKKFNSNSKNIAEALQLNHHSKDISYCTDNMISDFTTNLSDLNRGNLRARVRAMYLYTYNSLIGETMGKRARVIGTSNKSESFIGYDTKYGDGAADMFPIDNLFKSEVYQLLDYFVSIGWLREEMVDRIPSAGLEEDQTDEKDIGYSYDSMEYPIKFCLKNYDKMEELIAQGVPDLVNFVWNRHKSNRHKQEQIYTPTIESKHTCDYTLRKNNDSEKYNNGKLFKTSKGVSFKIIGKVDKRKNIEVPSTYLIEFCDKYKYRMCVTSDAILQGKIKNPYTPH